MQHQRVVPSNSQHTVPFPILESTSAAGGVWQINANHIQIVFTCVMVTIHKSCICLSRLCLRASFQIVFTCVVSNRVYVCNGWFLYWVKIITFVMVTFHKSCVCLWQCNEFQIVFTLCLRASFQIVLTFVMVTFHKSYVCLSRLYVSIVMSYVWNFWCICDATFKLIHLMIFDTSMLVI